MHAANRSCSGSGSMRPEQHSYLQFSWDLKALALVNHYDTLLACRVNKTAMLGFLQKAAWNPQIAACGYFSASKVPGGLILLI